MKNRSLLFILGGLLVVALFIGGFFWTSYNSLVTRNQEVDAQWAQVETQLQRRLDLIPNLVESVKGIFNQEKAVFNSLAAARTKYGGAVTPDEKAEAGTQVQSALGRLLVVVENYPQLRSQANVTQFMDELSGTENRVSVERSRYNERVLSYNRTVKRFPGNIAAGMFGYSSRAYFQSTQGSETPPKVTF